MQGGKQRTGYPLGGFWQLRWRSLGWGAREGRTDAAGVQGRHGGLCTRETSRQAHTPSLEMPGTKGGTVPGSLWKERGQTRPSCVGGRAPAGRRRVGARAARAAPPGVQACDGGEDAGPEPPRCPRRQARCLSPHPYRKGGQGRVAAEAPMAGPAYAGRVRQVATGASREAGAGRSGAIGTWGGWRLGV